MELEDGSAEYRYAGADKDKKKTAELQNQGKKINLSLTEMSQFFMKMAEGIKAKKLKPGDTIPGCNSYFLCKYLKDTMLHAKTYLFCAIRPELKFQVETGGPRGSAGGKGDRGGVGDEVGRRIHGEERERRIQTGCANIRAGGGVAARRADCACHEDCNPDTGHTSKFPYQ